MSRISPVQVQVQQGPRPTAKIAIIAWPDGRFEVQADVPSPDFAIRLLSVVKQKLEQEHAGHVLMGRQSLVIPDGMPAQK